MDKHNITRGRHITINENQTDTHKIKPTICQRDNIENAFSTGTHRRTNSITHDVKNIHFRNRPNIATYHKHDKTTMLTYNSGADGHYLSKKDRKKLGLLILRVSAKKVGVANSGACNGKYVNTLPVPQISNRAAESDTFEEFPTSLMSVGKKADNGNMSIFTKDGVTVYKEEYVMITCQRKTIIIGKRDECGRYCIPLTQYHGQCQPHRPTKEAKIKLQQANSVYGLPSKEEAIKWMYAVCGYPVKSTWIKATKAGNYIGWPMLT